MLKLLDKIIFLISLLAMTGLAGAYTSSYTNPNTFIFPSLLGLAYPYLLISNLLLFLYWIIRWKKMVWAELLIILLGIPAFLTYYGIANPQEKDDNHDISILSYNVRYFDVYNWSKQKDTKEKLFDYLNHFKGDVICLQEFSIPQTPTIAATTIPRLKSYPHHYIRKDMAIFSRLPILTTGYLPFDDQYSSTVLFCDLLLGQDTLRLYSVHLESYKLGNKERQFMKQISQGLKTNDFPEGARNLTTRLATANRNRARQAEQIHQHIQQSPHKVILCGDFNDTPLSYTYKTIKTGMIDSFIEKGRGLGNTYIGEFPSFRIDYILHSPDFKTVSYLRDTTQLSDHYPIQGKLKLKK
ncbi:MAG: endonuclease/exonuclease/phosphatase family protein [Odoribacter sp.]